MTSFTCSLHTLSFNSLFLFTAYLSNMAQAVIFIFCPFYFWMRWDQTNITLAGSLENFWEEAGNEPTSSLTRASSANHSTTALRTLVILITTLLSNNEQFGIRLLIRYLTTTLTYLELQKGSKKNFCSQSRLQPTEMSKKFWPRPQNVNVNYLVFKNRTVPGHHHFCAFKASRQHN